MTGPLLEVEDLSVTFGAGRDEVRAVVGVSFSVERGRALGIVGESGSGKSVTARTLVGLAGDGARVSAGRLAFDGVDLTRLSESGWRRLRGRRVGLVLQDALSSLDPLRTVGAEVAEPLRAHRVLPRAAVRPRVRELLAEVGVPEPAERAGQYPHQLSGGLRQRALIASAVAAGPDLVLADEPTTALDVTVQAQVLDLLRRRRGAGGALLLISHDLAVVAGVADDVAVMYAGRVVEAGPAAAVLGAPRHPYTRALLDAVPVTHGKGTRLAPVAPRGTAAGPAGCPYADRCSRADDRCRAELPARIAVGPTHEALCWHPVTATVPTARVSAPAPGRDTGTELVLEVDGVGKRFRRAGGGWRDAVRDVSLTLRRGEALGVVGESGSGKTTLARIVLGLLAPDSGTVRFAGAPWSGLREPDRRARRGRIQAIQQDPLGSFEPRYRVRGILGEALAAAGVGRADRDEQARGLLEAVGLPASALGRRPRELSGGQRQRVAIARALAPGPDLLVCDEPVSALDVSVQAQILDLLADLQARLGVATLVISHDLGVIRHVSDRVLVMKDGAVVETGEVDAVFTAPRHAYTQELLAAVPRPGKTH